MEKIKNIKIDIKTIASQDLEQQINEELNTIDPSGDIARGIIKKIFNEDKRQTI